MKYTETIGIVGGMVSYATLDLPLPAECVSGREEMGSSQDRD